MDYPHFSRQVLNTSEISQTGVHLSAPPFHALFFKCCLHIGFRACLRHPQPQDCSCVISMSSKTFISRAMARRDMSPLLCPKYARRSFEIGILFKARLTACPAAKPTESTLSGIHCMTVRCARNSYSQFFAEQAHVCICFALFYPERHRRCACVYAFRSIRFVKSSTLYLFQ